MNGKALNKWILSHIIQTDVTKHVKLLHICVQDNNKSSNGFTLPAIHYTEMETLATDIQSQVGCAKLMYTLNHTLQSDFY